MTIASRIAKHTIQTAKYLDIISRLMIKKWEALLTSRPSYVLLEPKLDHPYVSLMGSAQNLLNSHDQIVATLLDIDMGSGNLREELDKLQAHRIYDGIELDADIDRLRLMDGVESASVTAKEIADKTQLMLNQSILVVDSVKLSEIKNSLALQHEKIHISNHIEKPFLDITPDCRAALKEVKSMCKALVLINLNGISVGSHIESNYTTRFLKL
jgi:hypothetical protein